MNCSKAEWLGSLPEEQRLAFQAEMTPSQLEELNWDWEFWARPNQLIPKGDWLTWLLLAGRGFGKTRSAAEAVRALVCGATPLTAGKHARIALVAETAADARDVMVEGESGLLAVHPQEFRPLYEPSKRRLTWPNGALATLYNAVEPDQLRGPQHSLAWCDELAKWRYAQETWDMLQFGLRLGARPQAIIATTPRPIPVLKQIIRQPGTVITRGTTFENRSNLAESFLSQVVSRYEGTRLGRQELSAEILDDIPGALWTRAVIDGRERLANCRKCRELSLRSILQVRADQDALPRRTADEAKDPASIATLGEFCPRSQQLVPDIRASHKIMPRPPNAFAAWPAGRLFAPRRRGICKFQTQTLNGWVDRRK